MLGSGNTENIEFVGSSNDENNSYAVCFMLRLWKSGQAEKLCVN